MSFYRWQGDDLIIACHLQPRASKDEFSGLHGDSLKIRIKAPPVEGKANGYLIKFLASQFGVSKRDVKIISGDLSREKRVAISSPEKLPAELEITLA
ncbi:DUF167 family protein [Parendozoicomonas haliclonae]|uniref:UPF0235 protein EHSB41UT_04038 n=1 Tax=Parendozoicomonas haliclonae TaxID=1960125 RepID=A0A1X7APK3_9GAMM|nr:DUF167 family protein [Parendozoicomonas haliclonae]SMA50244.1 hypothetical protein EHSB41UT_04038 [Parendozoicomonas haliclonae]